MKPYYIYAPPFSWSSAGIIVMHRLAHELRNKGCEVYINTEEQNPNYPPINVLRHIDVDGIAVYPEIVHGNPFCCKNVVRYILHIPGYWGGPKTFNESDLLFVYDDEWNRVAGLNLPDERILTIMCVEEQHFPNYGWKRDRDYYFIGKGRNLNLHPQTAKFFGGKEDFKTTPQRKAMVDNLNKCKDFYTYDTACGINEIAGLCGANVVVIEDKDNINGYKMQSFILEKNIRMRYDDFNTRMHKHLDNFIKITQGRN